METDSNMPLVSVVMPMRNAQAYVRDALLSVLQETEVALEVVVVDDGSTDRSRAEVEALADPRVRMVAGPCRGVSASINTGLKEARGDIVMQCDADDLYAADRIRKQVLWLEQNPAYDALCGAFSTIDTKGRLVGRLGFRAHSVAEDIDEQLRQGIARTSLCTFALRRRVLDVVGLHREFFETSSDIDFQLRMGDKCHVRYVPENTYFYRLHGSSITHTQGNARRMFFERMAHEFQEQRHARGTDELDEGRPPVVPELHQDDPHEVAVHIQGMLIGEAWRELAAGNRRCAAGKAWRALCANPSSLGTWKSALVLALRLLRPGAGQRNAAS